MRRLIQAVPLPLGDRRRGTRRKPGRLTFCRSYFKRGWAKMDALRHRWMLVATFVARYGKPSWDLC